MALIALNFTFSIRYAVLSSDSLVQQAISIGFGLQLLMICLTVTLMNPVFANCLFVKRAKVYPLVHETHH